MSVDHDDYPTKFEHPPVPRTAQDNDDEQDETATDVADENADPADEDVVTGLVMDSSADADSDSDSDSDSEDDEDEDEDDVVIGVVTDTDDADDTTGVVTDDAVDNDAATGVMADDASPVTPVRTGGAHRYPLPAFPGPDAPSTGASPSFTPTSETTTPETATDQEDSQASWQRIKSGFVDDPRASVEEAAAIVEEAAETLVATIQERERVLRGAWEGNGTDTERLRTAFRDYRTLYDKLSQI
ncbi:MAG: hypothetical protein ABSA93_32585 [Streptosporangiaceae bacterium]|jgi:hypothetical protein